MDGESGPGANLACDRNSAALALNGMLGDGKSQPRASGLPTRDFSTR